MNNQKILQDQYNDKVIKEIIDDYKSKGAEKVRLLKYYEYKKWGVYFFEHSVKIAERDQMGNKLRELERNFYSAVEIRMDGSKINHESKKDSRRTAEDAYSNVIRSIENFKNKGRDMSQYAKVMKVLALDETYNNPEINNAIKSAKKTFYSSIKEYKDNEEEFNKNVNVDDEIADLSVVLLSASDSYGDFNEEVEIRSLLEMIWAEDEEDLDDDEGTN